MAASVVSGTAQKHKQLDREALLVKAHGHACARHALFHYLQHNELSTAQIAALLRNYDAHAGVLRRLLLKAASIMPETAAGYVLENVRNEYGNGDPAGRHQLQLLDLALSAGVGRDQFQHCPIEPGVRAYIAAVTPLYFPLKTKLPPALYRPAVAAGAITATEILALVEFSSMQAAFTRRGLEHHVWFDHINVELEHTDESVSLALHFICQYGATEAVRYGMDGVLEANCLLYDGLLGAIRANS